MRRETVCEDEIDGEGAGGVVEEGVREGPEGDEVVGYEFGGGVLLRECWN